MENKTYTIIFNSEPNNRNKTINEILQLEKENHTITELLLK